MWCFGGCGGPGRKLLSKALSAVSFVIFLLLCMPTAVTAPLVANASRTGFSAVEERLLTRDGVMALQEIARALQEIAGVCQQGIRIAEQFLNYNSWVKLVMLPFVLLFAIEIVKIFTGVFQNYLVDCGRNGIRQWRSQMSPTSAGREGEERTSITDAETKEKENPNPSQMLNRPDMVNIINDVLLDVHPHRRQSEGEVLPCANPPLEQNRLYIALQKEFRRLLSGEARPMHGEVRPVHFSSSDTDCEGRRWTYHFSLMSED